MTQNQNDRLTMLELLQVFFILNNSRIVTIADLVTAVAALTAYIKDLKKNRDIQNINIKGIAGNKSNLIKTTILDILVLSGALVNLGVKNNDDEMQQKFGFTKSDLEKLRDNDLLSIAGTTATVADDNIADLADSGVTPAMVSKLDTDVTTLDLLNTAPGAAKEQKKLAGQNIKAIFPKVRLLTRNSLKPLMRTNFFVADIEFYNQFIEALQIINTGIHHLSVYGKVISSIPNTVVDAATIKVFKGSTLVTQVKSGAKGNFRIKNLGEGTFIIEVSRLGFNTQTFTGIIVMSGKGTKVNFTIVPL